MKTFPWLLLLAIALRAADDKVSRGAEVFRTSCAVPYCHGPEGKAARAPGLAGRNFQIGTVIGIAAAGIPNTAMPSFAGRLKPEDMQAVAAYVVSLNATGAAAGSKPAAVTMPPAVQQGRALFFDAARTGACGSCHEVGGRGIRVSIALQDLTAARLEDLRAVATPGVVTARPTGEDPFPAVVVEKTAARIRVYDLSSRLPVLRSFSPEGVALTPGSSWSHSSAAGLYTVPELDAISRYLHWVAGR